MIKILTWDAEIRNCIPEDGVAQDPNLKYCKGWDDKAGMGISLIGAYLNWLDEYRFYGEDNILDLIADFKQAELVTGFNIFGFDTALLKATLVRLGHDEETGQKGKCYDPFLDIKVSKNDKFPKGWKLGNIAESTLGLKKNDEGAHAPILWQTGQIGKLVTYLANDVKMEYALVRYILRTGTCKNVDPVEGPMELKLKMYKKFLKAEE